MWANRLLIVSRELLRTSHALKLNQQVSGIEVMKQLQMDLVTKNTPVIIEIAYGDQTSARQAIKAGAREVRYKPFDLSGPPSILRDNLRPDG